MSQERHQRRPLRFPSTQFFGSATATLYFTLRTVNIREKTRFCFVCIRINISQVILCDEEDVPRVRRLLSYHVEPRLLCGTTSSCSRVLHDLVPWYSPDNNVNSHYLMSKTTTLKFDKESQMTSNKRFHISCTIPRNGR